MLATAVAVVFDLTFKFDLDIVRANLHTKNLGQKVSLLESYCLYTHIRIHVLLHVQSQDDFDVSCGGCVTSV